ncbi:MAG: aldehyde dehydrogenase family protein, partial [Acidobacteriota bacterium]|nr:aldehyde dehydrogenase family protein [Acidobacteriota bacterium]
MSGSKPEMKITYATMSANQMEALHLGIDEAIEQVKAQLGKTYPMYIDGEAIESAEQFEDLSPNDTRIVLARFQKGTADHVRDAVRAARVAAADWGGRPWRERVAIVRKIGDGIRAQRWELAAWMGFETGKNRLECVGDIEEAADFMTYYCDQMEAHDGYCQTMDKLEPNEENTSVMRPHGVWAVISPFNFPMALAAGPAGGALVAGNTVVLKPASDTPRLGLRLYDIAAEAGVPPGVFNVVTGPGNSVGQEIAENAHIDGIVFTGSKEVGMMLSRENGGRPAPRPVITEMGGKNPTLVMSSADLD